MQAVIKMLTAKGMASGRIVSVCFGKENPAKPRRLECISVGQGTTLILLLLTLRNNLSSLHHYPIPRIQYQVAIEFYQSGLD